MYNKINILKQLLKFMPNLILERNDKGESIEQYAEKHNRKVALDIIT